MIAQSLLGALPLLALLLYAVIFGWMFFGDVPRLTMMAGAALIIASGLFIFVREQMLKKKQDRPMEVP